MLWHQSPAALAAYLDGELPADQRIEFQQHLRGCTDCAAQIAELVSLRRSLLPARNSFTPSEDFRRRIQQQIAAPRRQPALLRFLPAAMALAAMLLVVLAIGWMQHSRRADGYSEVADLHVNALASANPYDIVSSDRYTVKPWFQGRIPFSFNVPEFAGSEFTLLGGRLVYLHQQPGAQLIVAMRQHKISVLIFQASSASAEVFPAESDGRRNAFNVASWQSQGLQFFVVGDADPGVIDSLAVSLKQANR